MLEAGTSTSSSSRPRSRSRSRSHSDSNSPDETESRMADSLYLANATIDEYTSTLAKISRAPTPDEPELLRCCCGKDDCENTAAWFAFKNKLESRLILCAEVGQALLEKHEAYIRRHGSDDMSDNESNDSRPATPTVRYSLQDSQTDGKVFQLTKENSVLEKRLNAALLNAEVVEASNKASLKELSETKEALARLTVNQVKSTGWETRLNVTAQEKDDLQQELEVEHSRAKIADGQLTALRERCAKQQAEINRMYDEMAQQRQSRKELSEEILRDARARLQMVQQQQLGHIVMVDNPEVTQVMESLVADNEALKRDVAELQNLLTESREDVRTLREEIEESRASALSAARPSSFRPEHGHASSWASSFGQRPISPALRSAGLPTQPYEPLTPSTETRPLSRSSRSTSRSRVSAVHSPRPGYPPSRISVDNDERALRAKSPESVETRPYKRPLLLLSQTRGVQTDDINWSSLLGPMLKASTDDTSSSNPRGEGYSESSSLSDIHASTIAALVDRANALFVRLAQADARTLTNRLKRQRLTGDVSHLSHATVTSILNEVNGLRSHFRTVLEDERVVSTCTRKELRALLTLLREIFAELGQIRITLNDIILDPSLAAKVSEISMDPSKGLEDIRGHSTARMGTIAGSWMAPLSKLFSGAGNAPAESKSAEAPQASPRTVPHPIAPKARIPRFVPKLGPALAASTTTVNVEFSNAGVGRSVSSNMTATVAQTEGQTVRSSTPVPGAVSSRAVMGIFAGAPQLPGPDSWVVLPKPQRKLRGAPSAMDMRAATLTRSAGRFAGSKLSRNVDAVIDAQSSVHDSDSDSDEDGDEVPDTLLERTLRPRGLSDSSIRSTFLKDAAEAGAEVSDSRSPVLTSPGRQRASLRGGSSLHQSTLPAPGSSRPSVFQAFSKAFVIPALSSSPSVSASGLASTPTAPPLENSGSAARAPSPRRMPMLPSLTHWAATRAGLDVEATEQFVGSVRDVEDPGPRHWTW